MRYSDSTQPYILNFIKNNYLKLRSIHFIHIIDGFQIHSQIFKNKKQQTPQQNTNGKSSHLIILGC